jgi:hypothetical protein
VLITNVSGENAIDGFIVRRSNYQAWPILVGVGVVLAAAWILARRRPAANLPHAGA